MNNDEDWGYWKILGGICFGVFCFLVTILLFFIIADLLCQYLAIGPWRLK